MHHHAPWSFPMNTKFKFLLFLLSLFFFLSCETENTIPITDNDTTPPANVSGLYVAYNYKLRRITFTWTDPDDEDFRFVHLTYKIGDATPVTRAIAKHIQKLEVSDVEPNLIVTGSTVTLDETGNQSAVGKEIKMTTTVSYVIDSITLDKTHLLYSSSEKITATIKGEYFSYLPTEEMRCLRLYCFKDSTYCLDVVPSINKTDNTATAQFNMTNSAVDTNCAKSDSGTVFTIKYSVDGVIYDDVVATFRLSDSPNVSLVEIYEYDTSAVAVTKFDINDVTSSTKITARFVASNLSLAKSIVTAFYNYAGERTPYTATVTETFNSDSVYNYFYCDVPVPQEEGLFYLKLIIDGTTINTKSAQLQIYGEPRLTQISIPQAGLKPVESEMSAVLQGLNFNSPNIDKSKFTVSCSSDSSVTTGSTVKIVSDTTAYIKLKIPSEAGSYPVTVSYDLQSVSGTLYVDDYSGYALGDLYLQDRAPVNYEHDITYTKEQIESAVGIIYFNAYGVPTLLGIKNFFEPLGSAKNRCWAKSGCAGNTTNISQIYSDCIVDKRTINGLLRTTITSNGDTDGSDNWNIIKSIDSNGTSSENVYDNYRAFDYIENYESKYEISGYNNWYMPSLSELLYIYQSKQIFENILKALGAVKNDESSSSAYLNGSFWSSSQSLNATSACYVNMSDGSVQSCTKNEIFQVLAVRSYKVLH